VFTLYASVYIVRYTKFGSVLMANGTMRVHKHFRLNAVKIRQAQKVLHANTETEAIERALDLVISEHQRNRVTERANERFAASGIRIKDVYGKLEP
jgi:hypothetical protein